MAFRSAGFGIRAIAESIDLLLLASMAVGLLFGVAPLLAVTGLIEDGFDPARMQRIAGALCAFLAAPYFTIAHSRWQATLGKRWVGIRVVDTASGRAPSSAQALIRTLGYVFSALPLGGGFLMAAVHPEKRALHDLMAGTRVVRT